MGRFLDFEFGDYELERNCGVMENYDFCGWKMTKAMRVFS